MSMIDAYRAFPSCRSGGVPAFTQHLFLVAIRGEPRTPLLRGNDALHRMQVILAAPGELPPLLEPDAIMGPLPSLPAPHRLTPAAGAGLTFSPREVTGDILRDTRGRLYERVGDHVRAMSQLFTGPKGEVIDLAPVAAETSTDAGDDAPAEEKSEADADDEPRIEEPKREHKFRQLARRLLPEPGVWRLIRYADFIDVVTPQLADSRRLQPSHQIACYLQLHEVCTATPLSTLEEAASRELGAAGKLVPLSFELCRRFAVSLPRPVFSAARHTYSRGIVPPGARFLTLRVALDPTADASPRPASAPPQGASNTASPLRTEMAASVVPPCPAQAAQVALNATAAPQLRTSIPEGAVKPWELRLSRDEAMYDMMLAARSGLGRVIDRLLHRPSRRALKRWSALLAGKSSDEQLWTVKPPRGSLGDPRVRRWAEQALQLGGYEVGRMLVEWELHWRRQGL